MRVTLGVTGSIAAYKALSLVRLFREAGHRVTVIPTAAALKFVGRPSWEALAGHSVDADVFSGAHGVSHVRLAEETDILVVAPATADFLGKAAHGLADDLLTNTFLMTSAPVVLAPAMHTHMWEHPATRANVATLRERGVYVLEPARGRLTGADSGVGRLPEPEEICRWVCAHLGGLDDSQGEGVPACGGAAGALAGQRVVISLGGTREPIDPVRFLGNRSSGKQGVALVEAALDAGAHVSVVAAHSDAAVPTGAHCVQVSTASQMQAALMHLAPRADVIMMAAAVADYQMAVPSAEKIKKAVPPQNVQMDFVPTPDILTSLTAARPAGQIVVGFAAETAQGREELFALGRQKVARKEVDLLVVNEVGAGRVFGQDTTEVLIFDGAGQLLWEGSGSKKTIAEQLLECIGVIRGRQGSAR